jgi:16S rRNA G1207 methylase RsmC
MIPRSPLEVEPMEAAVWGHELRLDTASGVFARGRLDVGTAVLLDRAPPPATGTSFLDLGCGYGVIAIALALARPDIDVWAVDINERALELTARNAQRMGVGKRVRAAHPDQVPAGSCSTASGPTPRSGSASRSCTPCCCVGSHDSP